ncbi:MAG: DNA-binding response regulator [Prevotella sp.]
MPILIADRQGITQAGIRYLCQQLGLDHRATADKTELIEALRAHPDAAVVLDYTLFDIGDAAELQILSQRFPRSQWLLFSEDLSLDFIRTVAACNAQMGVVLKESPLSEIRQALHQAARHQRYICQRVSEMLLAPAPTKEETTPLTPTETQILRDIALGLTTREIAQKRFSSFHTVNTHRKNIFRKLGVNTLHEATKYALRAGLVDSAEYYI